MEKGSFLESARVLTFVGTLDAQLNSENETENNETCTKISIFLGLEKLKIISPIQNHWSILLIW